MSETVTHVPADAIISHEFDLSNYTSGEHLAPQNSNYYSGYISFDVHSTDADEAIRKVNTALNTFPELTLVSYYVKVIGPKDEIIGSTLKHREAVIRVADDGSRYVEIVDADSGTPIKPDPSVVLKPDGSMEIFQDECGSIVDKINEIADQ